MSVADERRTDTRAQIREVALELFAEHGYEKTSLREIAERLGITKAAVYYHFKTKEEILGTLFDELFSGLDEIVAWAREQAPGPEVRAEVLRRYQDLLGGPSAARLVRFLQERQASVKDLAVATGMKQRFAQLSAVMVPEGCSVEEQLRFRLSVVALNLGAFAAEGLTGTAQERRAAALAVALDLVS